MQQSATHAEVINFSDKMVIPGGILSKLGQKRMLLVYSRESKQIMLFPVVGTYVIKIHCALEELNVSFQKELINDLNDVGLSDVFVVGITTALDSETLVYEGFFQAKQKIDVALLKKNISAISDVSEVTITEITGDWI